MPSSLVLRIHSTHNAAHLLTLLVALATIAAPAVAAPEPRPRVLQQYTSDGHVLGFDAKGFYVSNGTYSLQVELIGSRGSLPVAEGAGASAIPPAAAPGGAAPLGRVRYHEVWPGIGVTYDAPAAGIARSIWHLAPGAAPCSIRLRYSRPVELAEDGSLTIEAGEEGQLRESAPIAWQVVEGRRWPVEVAFRILAEAAESGEEGGTVVGFRLGTYDPDLPLEIDPTLGWNTFLGGSVTDFGNSIAVDTNGNVYVTGYSGAPWGAPVRAYSGNDDAFVAKLDASGALVWNTFLGGGGTSGDFGHGIAVDSRGNVYVTGVSLSTWGSPVRAFSDSSDTFVAELDASGALVWNTFLGSNTDGGRGITVDGSGSIYVTGYSTATWGSPVRAFSGLYYDAFVAKLKANGVLVWNTFLGSSGDDEGYGVAVDSTGNVYVTGYSGVTWGSPMRAFSDIYDPFVAKLDASGALVWNTFLGGPSLDRGDGIAVDSTGNVYVTGFSLTTWGGTPVRAFSGGFADAYVAKLDSNGGLVWNTFLGGSSRDQGNGIAIDSSGTVYVTGFSEATWGTPVRVSSGGNDAFVARLDANGALVWNTFLGGSSGDSGRAIAEDSRGNVYVAGYGGAWGRPLRAFSGGSDAFVAQLDDATEQSVLEVPTLSGLALILLGFGLAALGLGRLR